MADIGWRRRRGSSPAARTGARQRAGLTPASASLHASGRRFTHNSSGQSKNPLTAITVSTATLASASRLSAARLRWYAHAPALLRCRPTDRYAMRACPRQ